MKSSEMVAVNERGRRIGESHPRAKLTDHEVDLLRDYVEQALTAGKTPMQAYREVAEKMETSVQYAKDLALYRKRAESVRGFRRVKAKAGSAA